jgi:hypothetical protein
VLLIEDCFGLPCIATLKRTDLPALKFVLNEYFAQLNLFFAENMRMTPQQIKLLIDYFLTKFINLTIGDVKLITERVMKSKIFGQLSPNVIIQVAESYFDERCEIAAQISEEDHYLRREVEKNNNDENFVYGWYEYIRENGIGKSEKELRDIKESEFQKFKAEYIRKNMKPPKKH